MNAQVINQLFVDQLNDGNMTKLASETGAYIKGKLREASFARKILPMQYITAGECQVSINHDGLVKIVDVEPDSFGMELTLRGQPTVRYVEGERFEVSFGQISSEEFEKTEEELLAYQYPITDVIQQNMVKDMQKVEDEVFVRLVNAAAVASGKSVAFGTLGTKTILDAMTTLFNTLEVDPVVSYYPVKTSAILMAQEDFNKLSLIPASIIGNDAATQQYVNGFAQEKLLGKNIIVTNKRDIVPAGTMYAFTTPEHLGVNYCLNDVKFFIEKKRNLIKMSSSELVGSGIINGKGVAKLTFS